MSKLSYTKAMNRALADELAADPDVCAIGEDVGAGLAGPTLGLLDRFGAERVVAVPLSEQAFTSLALGAALRGMRPVLEFQIPSLLFLVFEQIVDQAHKISLMTGGQAQAPITYVVPGSGSREGWAGQHSDHPYSLFAHVGTTAPVGDTDGRRPRYDARVGVARLFGPFEVQASVTGTTPDPPPVTPHGRAAFIVGASWFF